MERPGNAAFAESKPGFTQCPVHAQAGGVLGRGLCCCQTSSQLASFNKPCSSFILIPGLSVLTRGSHSPRTHSTHQRGEQSQDARCNAMHLGPYATQSGPSSQSLAFPQLVPLGFAAFCENGDGTEILMGSLLPQCKKQHCSDPQVPTGNKIHGG